MFSIFFYVLQIQKNNVFFPHWFTYACQCACICNVLSRAPALYAISFQLVVWVVSLNLFRYVFWKLVCVCVCVCVFCYIFTLFPSLTLLYFSLWFPFIRVFHTYRMCCAAKCMNWIRYSMYICWIILSFRRSMNAILLEFLFQYTVCACVFVCCCTILALQNICVVNNNKTAYHSFDLRIGAFFHVCFVSSFLSFFFLFCWFSVFFIIISIIISFLKGFDKWMFIFGLSIFFQSHSCFKHIICITWAFFEWLCVIC